MSSSSRPTDLAQYLEPTWFLDADSPAVRAFAEEQAGDAADEVSRAVRLFYAVRDGIRYDPYSVPRSPEGFRASAVLARGVGFCVTKAIVLATATRVLGIPSRLGFADVRNHLATERLRQAMGTDVFVFHGYTELYLEQRWVKATPTFEQALCDRFGVRTLDFDGRSDSLYHPFDRAGKQHMEYLRDRGTYADFPLDRMVAAFRQAYPQLFAIEGPPPGDFAAEKPLDPDAAGGDPA